MGLAEVFRAKVEGMSSKNFLGVPPDPSFIVPCCIFVLSVRQVLISKISGATWGLVYLECLGSGNSIGPHPDHSHLYCHTQIYLVCKNFRRKISPVCTSHTLQTGRWRRNAYFSLVPLARQAGMPYSKHLRWVIK